MRSPFCIKICSKCGKLLVANNFNFNKDKGEKDGLQIRCKECNRKKDREYYNKNREKKLESCKEYRDSHKDEIRMYMENNREKIRENQKRYADKHKEEISERQKQWYQNNKEDVKERQREYHKDNPNVSLNKRNRRRTKENLQGNGITKEQWLEMMTFFNWECAYSGEYLGYKDNSERTIDHIIPINNNGKHEIWNCVPMSRKYNCSKKDSKMIDWYEKQVFFSKERLNKIYEWIEYAKKKWNTPR